MDRHRPKLTAGSWTKNTANPILTPSSSGWDGDDVIGSGLALRNGTYQALYSGGSGDPGTLQIGHASGSALDSLSKDTANPVIPTSSSGWDSQWTLDPSEPYYDGSTWHVIYAGKDGSGNYALGHATNSNADMSGDWTKDSANPVLTPSDLGSWASQMLIDPSIEVRNGTQYLAFAAADSNDLRQIGLATSTDWTNWSLSSSNPIIKPSDVTYADNNGKLTAPTVWTDADGYHHWWFDADPGNSNQEICHMSSTNLESPNDDPNNPVLKRGGSGKFDENDVVDPSVIEDGTELRMIYTGYDNSTHREGAASINKDEPSQL